MLLYKDTLCCGRPSAVHPGFPSCKYIQASLRITLAPRIRARCQLEKNRTFMDVDCKFIYSIKNKPKISTHFVLAGKYVFANSCCSATICFQAGRAEIVFHQAFTLGKASRSVGKNSSKRGSNGINCVSLNTYVGVKDTTKRHVE